MPVLSLEVWFLIAVVTAAVIVLAVCAAAYMRTMNRLHVFIRKIYLAESVARPIPSQEPALRLDWLVLGIRPLDIQDKQYDKLLFVGRIQIAICAVAFLGGLIALAVLFRIPASCCTWGTFALS